MREKAYRALLSRSIQPASANSYVSYCDRVRRELGVDVDQLDLSEQGIANVANRLKVRGVNLNTIGNCLSALRAYAQLDAGSR